MATDFVNLELPRELVSAELDTVRARRQALSNNEDVKEFYLGLSAGGRKSYRDVKHYKRRKRWLT